MDSTSSTLSSTNSPRSNLRKSTSTDSRMSTRSIASFSSPSLQYICSASPKAAEGLISTSTVAVGITRSQSNSMTSKEGLQALRDGHDEAMRKLASNEAAVGNSTGTKKGWFGSTRKASRTTSTSPLAAEVFKDAVSTSAANNSVDENAPALGATSETSSPDSTIDLETPTDLPSSGPVDVISPVEESPGAPQQPQPLLDTNQSISSSKGSWFARKEPPAISITNPTPTNSPSKPPSCSSFNPHSPPNPSPLSSSTTSPFFPSDTLSNSRNNRRNSSKGKDREKKGASLLMPSNTSSSPKSIPAPKTRPRPFAFSPTATASIDSHVPTLGELTPPNSPSRPRVIVPAPAIPISTTSWDTIRPRLSLPLLGRRKVPVEEFVTAVENIEDENEPKRDVYQTKDTKAELLLKKISKESLTERRPNDHTTEPILSAKSTETNEYKDLIGPTPQLTKVGPGKLDSIAQSVILVSTTASALDTKDSSKQPNATSTAETEEEKDNNVSQAAPAASSSSWFSFFSRSNSATEPNKSDPKLDANHPKEETVTPVANPSNHTPTREQFVSAQAQAGDRDSAAGDAGSITPKGIKSVQSVPPAVEGAAPSGVSLVSVPVSAPTSKTDKDVKEEDEGGHELESTNPATNEGWFGWWLWGSASSPALIPSESKGDEQKNEDSIKASENEAKSSEGDGRKLTEAEQVKEAALARDSTSLTVYQGSNTANNDATVSIVSAKSISGEEPSKLKPSVPEHPQSPDTSSQHSLLMSTSAARTSWVNFFTNNASLRNWNQKRIEAGPGKDSDMVKSGDGEEEVMTIDFGEEGTYGGTKEVSADAKSVASASGPAKGKANSVKSTSGAVALIAPVPPNSKQKDRSRPSTPEPPKDKPQPPITDSNKVKKDLIGKPTASSNASTRSTSPTPSSAKRPSFVLPTFEDTFDLPPRSILPTHLRPDKGKGKNRAVGLFKSGVTALSGYLLGVDIDIEELERRQKVQKSIARRARTISMSHVEVNKDDEKVNEKGRSQDLGDGIWWDKDGEEIGVHLPRHLKVLIKSNNWMKKGPKVKGKSKEIHLGNCEKDYLRGCKNIVVIGVHGWFPGTLVRSVIGAPTGTSTKFASMMTTAVNAFIEKHGHTQLDQPYKITSIPLEGEGTVEIRVDKLYDGLFANEEWVTALHNADVIFIATHSQGSIASTMLLDRLIEEGHICTDSAIPIQGRGGTSGLPIAMDAGTISAGIDAKSQVGGKKAKIGQRIGMLAMCGIHLGPLNYLSGSLVGPYLHLFESAAAKELFEFQDTENEISQKYIKALERVLDAGLKCVYIASLNDQVVPIYSGVFAAASHPSILRALYIDGEAYSSSDFLSNLLILLLRIRNAGLDDNSLLAHLSEATAGSLNGIGHSTAYEDLQTYSLAVRYLFETSDAISSESGVISVQRSRLRVESFQAKTARNDYEIPWALREVIAHESGLFEEEWQQLAKAFNEWNPKTTILRDMKRKLQPIQRLRNSRL